MEGKCKWFDEIRGFGFIAGEDNNDYFCHQSQIRMDGFRSLAEGQPVIFDIEEADRGPKAINIQLAGGVNSAGDFKSTMILKGEAN